MGRFILFLISIALLNSCRNNNSAVEEVPEVDRLRILLSDSASDVLDENARLANEQGIISADLKNYVPCHIIIQQDTVAGEIRLKGDWTDHVSSEKVSYRIKLNEGEYKGMDKFSIQKPQTRNDVHELFMHKLFQRENLLTTHYEIIRVQINDEAPLTYALEEHFDDKLIEHSGRPEGPILKIDESGLWAHRLAGEEELRLPIFDAAVIMTFGDPEKRSDEMKYSRQQRGIELVNKYKYSSPDITNYFDLDKMACYYALMDLGAIDHSQIWHNQRFYYNYQKDQLELIGFDMHPAADERLPMAFEIFKRGPKSRGYFLEYRFFVNDDFREKYIDYLKKFSERSFIDQLMTEFETELNKAESYIQLDSSDYIFERDFYYRNADTIKASLSNIESAWDEFLSEEKTKESYHYKILYDDPGDYFLLECSVNAYRDKSTDKNLLYLENYHLADIELVSYFDKKGEEFMLNTDSLLILSAYSEGKVDTRTVLLEKRPVKLMFKASNTGDKVYEKDVFQWMAPEILGSHPK